MAGHPSRVPSGQPVPLLPTERRLVEVIVEAIDLRFRGLFNQELSHRLDRFSTRPRT